MVHLYGHIKDTSDRRDFMYTSHLMATRASLPSLIDLTGHYPPIMNQGEIGSCTGNSTASVIKYTMNKINGVNCVNNFATIPSRLFLYTNGKLIDNLDVTQDSGCSVRGVLKGVSKYFCCDERDYWYVKPNALKKPQESAYKAALKYKHFQYLSVPQNLFAIKKCISDGYPVILGIAIYTSFESQQCTETGMVPMPNTQTEQLLGHHCINLCGYDDKSQTFLLCNSWGTGVGLPNKRGYYKIPYNFITDPNLSSDFWRISMFA
jgi:C1A family cysteine protease